MYVTTDIREENCLPLAPCPGIPLSPPELWLNCSLWLGCSHTRPSIGHLSILVYPISRLREPWPLKTTSTKTVILMETGRALTSQCNEEDLTLCRGSHTGQSSAGNAPQTPVWCSSQNSMMGWVPRPRYPTLPYEVQLSASLFWPRQKPLHRIDTGLPPQTNIMLA